MDNWTPEQRAAYEAHQEATAQALLAKYGTRTPRGNTMRMATDEETRTWNAFQETLKHPHQKLLERIGQAALDYWKEYIGGDMAYVSVEYAEEETNWEQLSYWREDDECGSAIEVSDRLFKVNIAHGTKGNYIEVDVWIALHMDETTTIAQAHCTYVFVEHEGHLPIELKPEDKAYMQYWSFLK